MLNVPSLEDDELLVQVLDSDSKRPKATEEGRHGDDMLGIGNIPLASLKPDSPQLFDVPLKDVTARKVTEIDGGLLTLELTYTPLAQ